MSTTQLTCEEFVELVTDYFEGAMTADERAAFEAHLERCDGCVAYLQQMRDTIAAARRVAPEDISADMREKFLGAFAGWKDER